MEHAASIEKEGQIYKRGARMQRWVSRYFLLEGSRLSYKVKKDTAAYKGQFDLVDGCVVTEITPEVYTSSSSGKLFTFWVVWPHDKHGDKVSDGKEEDSKSSNEPAKPDSKPRKRSNSMESESAAGSKDLKSIVAEEQKSRHELHDKVEQQIEQHQAHDHNIALGVKVAAVAVGGVVVGALTAGIGLIPYMTVVGVTALAGGGAVAFQSLRRPLDSRIILATETLSEALSWKAAIEFQIAKVVESKRPLMHSQILNSLLMAPVSLSGVASSLERMQGVWRRIGYLEGGIRVLQQYQNVADGKPTVSCYKVSTIVPLTPLKAFLALMETQPTTMLWPKRFPDLLQEQRHFQCSLRTLNADNQGRVIQAIDEHADTLQYSVSVSATNKGFVKQWPYQVTAEQEQFATISALSYWDSFMQLVEVFSRPILDKVKCSDDQRYPKREFTLNRYWKLEDDGSYLLTYSAARPKDDSTTTAAPSFPSMDSAFVIAPRKDADLYSDDIGECLVTCYLQLPCVFDKKKGVVGWKGVREMHTFMLEYMQQLVDLKEHAKYARVVDSSERVSRAPLSMKPVSSVGSKPTKSLSSPTVDSFSSKSNRSKGIVTEQPGLSDDEGDSHAGRRSVASKSGNSSLMGSPSPLSKRGSDSSTMSDTSSSRFSYFSFGGSMKPPKANASVSRESSGSSTNKLQLPPVMEQHESSTPPPATPEASATRTPLQRATGSAMARRRSSGFQMKKALPELTLLRNQLQCKEYEIQRLSKMIQKKQKTTERTSLLSTRESTIEMPVLEDLNNQYNQLVTEFGELMDQYSAMTGGEAYKAKLSIGKKIVKLLAAGEKKSGPVDGAGSPGHGETSRVSSSEGPSIGLESPRATVTCSADDFPPVTTATPRGTNKRVSSFTRLKNWMSGSQAPTVEAEVLCGDTIPTAVATTVPNGAAPSMFVVDPTPAAPACGVSSNAAITALVPKHWLRAHTITSRIMKEDYWRELAVKEDATQIVVFAFACLFSYLLFSMLH